MTLGEHRVDLRQQVGLLLLDRRHGLETRGHRYRVHRSHLGCQPRLLCELRLDGADLEQVLLDLRLGVGVGILKLLDLRLVHIDGLATFVDETA